MTPIITVNALMNGYINIALRRNKDELAMAVAKREMSNDAAKLPECERL